MLCTLRDDFAMVCRWGATVAPEQARSAAMDHNLSTKTLTGIHTLYTVGVARQLRLLATRNLRAPMTLVEQGKTRSLWLLNAHTKK